MLSKMKTCEEYRVLLIDAAAADSAPSYELCSHLDACAFCRTAFDVEKQLFAAIDTGLHTTANVEMPNSLLARVRIQLNEKPAPRISWIPASAAIAAVAAIVLTIAYVRGFTRGGVEPSPKTLTAAGNELPAENQPPQAVVPNRKSQPARREFERPAKNVGVAQAAEIEVARVIIPEGEKRGMQALLTNLQQGRTDGEVLLAAKAEKSLEELQVSPLAIAPIEVRPLVDVSTGPVAENDETKR